VSAAADRQLLPAVVRQGDDRGDVVRAGGLDDQRRVVVEAAVEDLAGLVVAEVVGGDHPSVHLLAQPWDRGGGVGHDSSFGSLSSGAFNLSEPLFNRRCTGAACAGWRRR
jgi:hypothetical protein